MADKLRIGLRELLRKARMEHDPDLLKEGVRVLSQALMEMEVDEHVGAAPPSLSCRSPAPWCSRPCGASGSACSPATTPRDLGGRPHRAGGCGP